MVRLILLSGLSGVLLGLSFPPTNISSFAWFFLLPFFFLEKTHPDSFRQARTRFFVGWFAGLISNLIIFRWLWKTFDAAAVAPLVTFNCWFFLSLLLGLSLGVFFLLYGSIKKIWLRPLLAPVIWILLDEFRSLFLTGLPWALIAHTQVKKLFFIQTAAFAGTAAVTFHIIATNICGFLIFSEFTNKSKEQFFKSRVVHFCFLILTLGVIDSYLGVNRYSREELNQFSVKVALLQGNIDQYQKWDAAFEKSILVRYQNLVEEAAAQNPDVIIWPESAVPGWIPDDENLLLWLKQVIRKSNTYHIVGAVSQREGKPTNSAFLFSPEGEIMNSYDKQHLVPFGEYIPFGGFLKKWIPYLGQLGTFEKGSRPVDFVVKTRTEGREVHISPNICYEAIFSRLIRRSVSEKTNLIVNLTNDGWYLDTGAPEQHYVTNIFRAIENQLPVVRCANTGISAVIDAKGRELKKSKLLETGVLLAEVPIK